MAIRPIQTAEDREENAFFVPNIIGYTRVIFAIASLYYMPLHPRTCFLLYSISRLLDALDGAAARRLGQCTQFGAVLDMITDRCTTTCLLMFIASAFPRWSIVLQGWISLDYSNHYIHIDKAKDRQYILFFVCLLNELFFIALYLLSFSSPTLMPSVSEASRATRPWSAGTMGMARVKKIDSAVPWTLQITSSLFMLLQQYVNVVQLIEASKWLVGGDLKMRRKMHSQKIQWTQPKRWIRILDLKLFLISWYFPFCL
ncbi:CDP-alcohol phosphatidyltransferase family protein [Aspergillus ruber CBS 135680]|uniref:CDP-diacylglycerol--inositol 3-phosphatidyltransferase n=1 Tax=Aspergillus ruber (strain CBS 135680) TaxID=1388766 RepID=A0A017SIY4_ASPRC|nr:CDP-diacylglycerol--inositol 3-phosphatidyltransferase [Aspergillus ruber CBS 135680]EYE96716.1 CDP-diacylglycerol--inositol 3-phosphatidyltransferase [Aspergillus ruber CBS 135680]